MASPRPVRRLPTAAAVVLGTVLGGPAAYAQTANLQVTSTVAGECTLSGGTLNFGTYVQGQATPQDGQTQIGVDCPAGINVTINMSQGANPGQDQTRNMGFIDSRLSYQLYRDSALTQVWGTGAGGGKQVDPTVGGSQPHEVYGQIFGGQFPSLTGDYTDTVIVSLAIDS